MFPAWRLKLREAKLAFRQGRLDEAGELLDGELREYLPGKKLSEKVARRIAERARGRIAAGETSAGWHDLEVAERLGEGAHAIAATRDAVLAERILQVQELLLAGEPELAMVQVAKMERRGRLTSAGLKWKRIAMQLHEAQRLAARGHFIEAVDLTQAALNLLPAEGGANVRDHLNERAKQLAQEAECFRKLNQSLHQALRDQDWSQVLVAAEEMLSVAPACSIARDARRQAWDAVGMKTTQEHPGKPAPVPVRINGNGRVWRSTRHRAAGAKVDIVTEPLQQKIQQKGPAKRWLLWIDGIGGFLVIHGDEVTIGQPAGSGTIELPIQADISRWHAVIRRDGGAYVLDSVHQTHVDGRRIDGPLVLADNNLVVLADNVRLRFKKPHVLSATARLEMESNHKTQPRADGVILMADTLVLGPKSHSHIRCREWANDVILFRRGEGLSVRTTGTLHIDGQEVNGHGPVAVGSQVEGEDFSLSLEAV